MTRTISPKTKGMRHRQEMHSTKNNKKNQIKRRQEMDLWGGQCTED